MNKFEEIMLELANANSSKSFWQALDSDFSHLGCSCNYHSQEEFELEGNFLLAKEEVAQIISRISDNSDNSPKDLFTLFAVNKMQDQISGGNNFESVRTKEFCKFFNINQSLKGVKIEDELEEISDAKKYLKQKLNLPDTKAKIASIQESSSGVLTKCRKISDTIFKDFLADPLRNNIPNLSKYLPSMPMLVLALGTSQMILRTTGNQKSADELRDNIGASTEMMAFFVVANGMLENLAHSFILAAPATVAVATYDKIYGILNSSNNQAEILEPSTDVESNIIEKKSEEEKSNISDDFNEERTRKIEIIKNIASYFQNDEMWQGLRKKQLAYQDNNIEEEIKENFQALIDVLPRSTNYLQILKDSSQHLSDSLYLLKSYKQVFEKKSLAGKINSDIDEFLNEFSNHGILMSEPSKDAREAGFCCRANFGLVNLQERIVESLPRMPSGSQIVIASLVISTLYSAREIYKSATGEEEQYSNYAIDFPDYLFSWLQLSQMYENLGGNATISDSFRDFFATFNLAENSTHLGIALAPIFAYQEFGSKIFENLHHAPANFAYYLKDSAINCFNDVCSFFKKERHENIDILPENQKDLKQIELNINDQNENLIAKTKSEEFDKDTLFCGNGDKFMEHFIALQNQNTPKSRITKPRIHEHGPNCNHK